MAKLQDLRIAQIAMTTRFIQGYRYLDRCGDALIRLENSLDENWVPGEIAPKGGQLKNDAEGMIARFDSESLSVNQHDQPDFEVFRDATCRIYEILCTTFEIERINAPVLRLIVQKGFETVEAAEQALVAHGFIQPDKMLETVFGTPTSLQFTYVNEVDTDWKGHYVHRRSRFNASVIRQEKQVGLDERLLKRVRLLPDRQRDAMQALMRLRRQVPDIPACALQFDLERSFETELPTEHFDLASFVSDSWGWLEATVRALSSGSDSQ